MNDSVHNEMSRSSMRPILLGIAVAILLAAGTASYLVYVREIAPRLDVRNPARYEDVFRKRWGFPQLTKHFPLPLPKDAQNVKFFYRPPGLNRSTYIQLRYSTSRDSILSMADKFSAESLYTFVGGDWINHIAKEPGVNTTYFFTGDGVFQNDYTIYVLQLTKLPRPPGAPYDGSSGVAISVTRNDIVFWATVI